MKTYLKILVGIISCFLAISCTDESKVLKEKIKSLESDIALLKFQMSLYEEEDASISTEEITYSTAKNNFGSFPVVARKVEPYLDGYKVRIEVGNMTTASFNGAKVTVKWGTPSQNPYIDQLQNQKKKELDLTTTFLPGSYGGFDVILSPAKPEEIKRIYVSQKIEFVINNYV